MHVIADPAVRQQLLADLGIQLWVPREQLAHYVRPQTARAEAPRADSPRADIPRPEMPRSAGSGLVAGPTPTASASTGSELGALENVPDEVDVAPFRVLAVSAPGVTLLLDVQPAGREAQLVRDLLAAATGGWRDRPAVRRFDWPPDMPLPGRKGPTAAERALRAFVGKDVADHGSRLLLVVDAVLVRLGDRAALPPAISLPPLARLGREGGAKAQLWAALATHRAAVAAERGIAEPEARLPGQLIAGDHDTVDRSA